MQIRKLNRVAIALVLGVAAVTAYLANVTFPLRRERAAHQQTLTETEPEIAAASNTLASFRQLRARVASEESISGWSAELLNSVPKSYLVDVPVKFLDILRGQGLENAEIQARQLLPFPALPDYAVARWQVRIPAGRILPFGAALAAVENAFPLGQLRDLSVRRREADSLTEIEFEFEMLARP